MPRNIALGDVADVISIVSGLMTILGVGGLISWSFFRTEKRSLPENAVSVFAFSVKTGVCLLLLWPFALLFFLFHIFVVLSLGPGHIGGDAMFWNHEYPVAYLASYLISVLLLLPLYFLVCASLYTWSLGPVWSFIRAFKR